LEPLNSNEDLTVTEALREVGNLINFKVLDHIIFSEEKYQSIIS